MSSLEQSASEPAPIPRGEARRVPLGRGRLLGLRFAEPVETEFQAHYLRVFRGRMRVLWVIFACGWIVTTLIDPVLIPAHHASLLPIRYVGMAILFGAIVATSLPAVGARAIRVLTTSAGVALGICDVVMFAMVPYPESVPIVASLVFVCVVSTIFVATLHYEYSAVGSIVLVGAFAVVVFQIASVPTLHAVGWSLAVTIVTAMSLSCTNLIEQYARKNFAQQRVLEEQAAAIVEKAEQLKISERKAQDANLAKSVFLSNMSHELRTPLNAVLGFAQLMERDPGLSEKGREHLRVIQRSGDHLLALINDVLAISKIEAGRMTLAERAFDLREMIRAVAEMIRVRTEAKGLQFLVTVADDVPTAVTGDEGKLRQVLVNLLGNAVKFTDAGGIALRVGSTATGIVVEIEDTGFGIAADEIDALFEAFGQTESGRRAKEGTGLGLAISRNFVRLMGGDIEVRSELDLGTTFTVDVPLGAAGEVAAEAQPRRVVGLAPGQPTRRLLVVDDVAENRALLVYLLATVGFDVREATNGHEAVETWRDWHPHLIWMDMRMPVLDGYAATQRIRERAAHEECRIIALTASAFQHDRERILAEGCDDFVTKPFREATIFGKLTEHLGVQFVYEDDGSHPSASGQIDGDGRSLSERLTTLPPELLTSLRVPMQSGDVGAALEAVGRIRERDEPLADELHRLLRTYRFEDVLDALE